jgi:hypothetical protein
MSACVLLLNEILKSADKKSIINIFKENLKKTYIH